VRRRNPQLFGSSVSSGTYGTAILGGLLGVTAAKLLPPMLPGLSSTPIMRILSSAAASVLAGWVGGRWNKTFGDAMLFGGIMQTGSIALNAFLPSVGGAIGLAGRRGLGELVPAYYPVPQNPINPVAGEWPMLGPASVGNGNGVGYRSRMVNAGGW
jgi:hypothetical protein